MSKVKLSQHLKLIHDRKKQKARSESTLREEVSTVDIRVARIADWNQRMENLFARQEI